MRAGDVASAQNDERETARLVDDRAFHARNVGPRRDPDRAHAAFDAAIACSSRRCGCGTETQYLRVYASPLRKKLDEDATRPRLITEPGVGYRLVDPSDE